MSAINETLIREVGAEVLGRRGQGSAPPGPTPPTPASGCSGNGRSTNLNSGRGKHGVFAEANDACAAAYDGFKQLKKQGVAARAKVVEIIKGLADANASEWGRIELEETRIGRLDHKIE